MAAFVVLMSDVVPVSMTLDSCSHPHSNYSNVDVNMIAPLFTLKLCH